MVNSIEWGRKLYHLIFGLLILFGGPLLLDYYSLTTIKRFIFGILIGYLILEYLRLECNWKIPFFTNLIRAKEQHRFSGGLYIIISFLLLLSFFDFSLAIGAMSMHYLADAASALTGTQWGKRKLFKNKTLIGTAAGFFTAVLVGFFIIDGVHIILGMALVAALLELYVDVMDDNLVVPLGTAIIGQLLLLL